MRRLPSLPFVRRHQFGSSAVLGKRPLEQRVSPAEPESPVGWRARQQPKTDLMPLSGDVGHHLIELVLADRLPPGFWIILPGPNDQRAIDPPQLLRQAISGA